VLLDADNLFLLAAGLAQITSALIFYVDTTSAGGGGEPAPEVAAENLTMTGNEGFGRVSASTPASSDPETSPENASGVAEATASRSVYDVVSPYVTSYVTVSVFPLVHVTQMWTVWITVLVALSRYVAICRPFQAPRLCTMRRVQQQVAGVAVAILLYNVPRFFEFRIEYLRELVIPGFVYCVLSLSLSLPLCHVHFRSLGVARVPCVSVDSHCSNELLTMNTMYYNRC